MSPAQHKMAKQAKLEMNIMEHLAAIETDISLRTKMERRKIGLGHTPGG